MAIYTPSNPYTTSYTFTNLTSGNLSFSSIVSTETDWGYYVSFTDNAPDPTSFSTAGLTGMVWGGFEAGVTGPNASTTFTVKYDVSETASNQYITSLQQLYLVDALVGPGATATATEQVYSGNQLVGTMTWSGTGGSSTIDNLAVGYQQLQVVLTVSMAIDSTGAFNSAAYISSIQQGFGQTAASGMAVIGDNVFLDNTGTGIQSGVDAGPQIAGVTVDLLQVNGGSVTQVATTTTNAQGQYQFVVVPGTYEVQFVTPTGYVFSPQSAGSTADLSSSPNPSTGITAPVVVTAGEVDNAVDAGMYQPAAFDVHVYYDANDNFTQDAGDTNQAGVTVTLLNGSGIPTGQTAVTDSNGNVSFSGLTPGSYEVAVVTPNGDIVTQSANIATQTTLVSGATAYAVEGLFTATPSLSVVKTVTSVTDVNHDGLTDAGDIINYNIQVTNSGNETLTGVTVVDPLTGGTIASNVTLAVGQQVDYATSYTVTQANVDNNGNAVGSQFYVSNMALTNGSETVVFTGSSIWNGGTEYAGQMDLTVNAGTTDNPAAQSHVYGWCVDVTKPINLGANNIVYTLQQLNVPNASVIAELAAWGDAQLASGPNALISAAVQSDIWMQEYNVGLAAGTNAALVNEINYINGTVLPTLSASNTGLEAAGVAGGFVPAQSLYLSQAPGQGDITNIATVTSDQTGPVTGQAQTPISYDPSLQLVKTISDVVDNNQAGIVTAGSVIDYSVEVINNGDVTLTGVNVVDPLTGATLAAGATLAVGASATYTTSYTISATDIANDGNPTGSGDIVNTATATSNQTGTQTATATEAIVIPVTISGEVFLDGNDTGVIAGAPGVAGVTVELVNAAGSVVSTTTTAANGQYSFTNEAPGTYDVQFVRPSGYTYSPTGGSSASLANPVTGATPSFSVAPGQSETNVDAGIFVAAPGLSIVKQVSLNNGATWSAAPADPTELAGGAAPEYRFIVSNGGNVVLTNIAVTDNLYGPIGAIGSLAAGATATLTATERWASGQVTDTATASGTYTPPGGTGSPVLSNTATAEYTGAAPGLSIVKEVSLNNGATWSTAPADPTELASGAKPEYAFIVTNSGNVALSAVAVIDSLYGTIGTIGSLAAGATSTLTATESWASGQVTDTATAGTTYTDSEGNKTAVVSNTATAEYVGATPSIAVEKLISLDGGSTWATAPTVTGEPVDNSGGPAPEYEFIVRNVGNVALGNVTLADAVSSGGSIALGLAGNIGTLAVGASDTITATGSFAVGQNTDTATVSGTYTDSAGNVGTVSSSASANYLGVQSTGSLTGGGGGLTVIKLPSQVVTGADCQVTYTFDVINSGSVALTDVRISDNVGTAAHPDDITPTLQTGGTNGVLLPGQTWVYTATVSTASSSGSGSGSGCGDTSGSGGSYCGTGGNEGSGSSGSGSSGGWTDTNGSSGSYCGTGSNEVSGSSGSGGSGGWTDTSGSSGSYCGTGGNEGSGSSGSGSSGGWTDTSGSGGSYCGTGGNEGSGSGGSGSSGGWTDTSGSGGSYCGTGSNEVSGSSGSGSSSGWTDTSGSSGSYCGTGSNEGSGSSGSGGSGGWTDTSGSSGSYCGTGSNEGSGSSGSGGSGGWTDTSGSSGSYCGTGGNEGSGSSGSGSSGGWTDTSGSGGSYCGTGGNEGSGSSGSGSSSGWTDTSGSSGSYCGTGGNEGSDSSGSGSGSGWTDTSGSSGSYCGTGGNEGSGSSGSGSSGGWTDTSGSGGSYCGTGGNEGSGSSGSGSSGGWTGTSGSGSSYCGTGGDSAGCGSSGSTVCGSGGSSSQADTVTVTATTVGSGFTLGDAGNFGIIAFGPSTFKAASSSLITGNVGIGDINSCDSSTTVLLGGGKIAGSLIVTGTRPSSTGGTVTGTISGGSTTLAADIATLTTLSQTLGAEGGTAEKFVSGMTLQATAGSLDGLGNEVFNITQWSNNVTIDGSGANAVVLNIASGVNINLDNLKLTGGLTADQVLINDRNSGTIGATGGDTFNGSVLAPNAAFDIAVGVTIDGHLYGGASGQAFTVTGGARLNAPANAAPISSTTTLTASDSKEVQVLSGNSTITVDGSAPTGSLASLYGTAEKLEFQYSPSDTVSLKQIQVGLASESGNNAASMAFVVMSNNSNPFASNAAIYFEGEVQTGENIFADATLNPLTDTAVAAPNNHFSTTPGADLYMDVFSSQAAFQNGSAPIQAMSYNTSGSQAMHLGDQIGSLTLVGYVGATGGHLVA